MSLNKVRLALAAHIQGSTVNNHVVVIGENGELQGKHISEVTELEIEYTKRKKLELFEVPEIDQYYADGYRKPTKPNKGFRLGSYKSNSKNKAK